jgi:hypothetical protein
MRAVALALVLAQSPGPTIWSAAVKVAQGSSKTLPTSGLSKGAWYELVSKGECKRRERARTRKWRQSVSGGESPQVMGVDFKVTVGGLEPMSVDHQERVTSFKADRDNPDVKVEDRSTAQAGIRCELTELTIRRPNKL